jgi:beta-lactamase regulating signal transducer with metallopeptidase domain
MAEKVMSNHHLAEQIARDSITITTASKTTMWGYFSSVLGFLADNGVAVAIGTLVAVGGFLVNFYFQRRRNNREKEIKDANEKREQERHDWAREYHLLQMKVLSEGIALPDVGPSVEDDVPQDSQIYQGNV